MEKHNETQASFQALKNVHLMYVKQQILLLNALKEKFGPDVVRVVEQVQGEEARKHYAHIASETGQKSIDDLINVLWQPLRQQRYEFTIERSENGVQIMCTACPLANLYRFLGGAEWGYHLYCVTDAYLVEGFNPNIGFTRTKTLMEGHECCNHFYSLKRTI